jgi:hypothetical protein
MESAHAAVQFWKRGLQYKISEVLILFQYNCYYMKGPGEEYVKSRLEYFSGEHF